MSACIFIDLCLLSASLRAIYPAMYTGAHDMSGLLVLRPVRAAGMLALHGIFTLVTRHGLEYPRFYERLYQLLTPTAFQVRTLH